MGDRDPAGDAARRLVEALAARYGEAEFPARAAAADIPRELWWAAGVGCPDAGSCGRWLRFRKGAVAGFVLAGRPDRDGVARWSLRPAPGTGPAPAPVPRDPPPVPPEPPPGPTSRPWWSTPPALPSRAGGAAGREGGAWWELDRGKAP